MNPIHPHPVTIKAGTALPQPGDIGELVNSLHEAQSGQRRTVAAVAARAMEEMVELCLSAGLDSGSILSCVADALANQAMKQGHAQRCTVYPSEIRADQSPGGLVGQVADVRLLLKDLVFVAKVQGQPEAAENNLMQALRRAKLDGDLYLDRQGTMRRRKSHVNGQIQSAGTVP